MRTFFDFAAELRGLKFSFQMQCKTLSFFPFFSFTLCIFVAGPQVLRMKMESCSTGHTDAKNIRVH